MLTKITKEEFDMLSSDDLTVKHQKEILDKISSRMQYIVGSIHAASGGTLHWYDYDNCMGDRAGFFNVDAYPDNISLEGNFDFHHYPHGNSFPTRWLYSDFEAELSEMFITKQNMDKLIKDGKLKHLDNMKVRIRAKLTQSELDYIKFKTIEEILEHE